MKRPAISLHWRVVALAVGLLFHFGSDVARGQCAILDQSVTAQTVLDYHTTWTQSFVAGLTGTLTSVGINVSSGGTSSSTRFRLYAGEGTGGTVLYSSTTVLLSSGWKYFDVSSSGIHSQAGSTYTIEFFNSSGTTGLVFTYNSDPARKMNGSTQFALNFQTQVELSTISPGSLSFGLLPLGASVTDTVTIQDPGCASLAVTYIDVSNNQYSVSPAANTLTGDIQKYAVTFAPTVSGIQNGTISFVINSIIVLTVQVAGRAISAEPTQQATQLSFANAGPNSITVRWAKGNGENRIVLMRFGSPVDGVPTDQTTYSANSVFGSGAAIGSGNFAVYAGTDSSVTVTGLYPVNTYYVSVFEFNGQGGGENYLVTSPANGSQTLPAGSPSVSSGTFISGTDSTASIQAAVTTNGARTAAHVAYGLTSAYGSSTPSDTIEDPIPIIAFNGTNQYAATSGYSSSLALTTAGTVEAWIRPLTTGDYEDVIGVGGAAGNGIQILVTSGGAVMVNAQLGSWISSTSSGVNVLDGYWHHVAAVVNGISLKLYVDGVLRASTSGFDNLNTGDAQITLGKHPSNIYYYKGSMGEVRVWNVALVQDTILAWMGGPITSSHPNFSNLKSYWRMDEQSGSTLYDASGNGNSGTLANGPTWSTTPKPASTQIATTLTGLQPSTTYHFAVVATNSAGSNTGTDAQFATQAGEPSVPASSFAVAAHTINTSSLQWTIGSGTGRLVLAKKGSAVDVVPVDGFSYTASAAFGSGSQLGTGNFVVFADTGSSVTVTGLLAGNRYYFSIFEYAGAGSQSNYLTTSPATCSDSVGAPLKRPGYAMRFDGIDDFIKIVDPTPRINYTIEFWVKPADVRSEAFVYRLSPTASNNVGTNLSEEAYMDSTGQAHHFATNLSGSFTANSTAGNLVPGQWYHIAITFNGITTNVYVNGIVTPLSSSGTQWQGGGDYYIGLRDSLFGHLNDYFSGDIDELRFWSVARGQNQIRSSMNQTLTGTESGLLGYYQFGEGAGTTAGDAIRSLSGTMSNFNFNSTSGWVPSTAPVGASGAFDISHATTTAGVAGAQIHVAISSTPSTTNNLGLYQYGTTTDVITGETFPSGIDHRFDCVWGVVKRGTVQAAIGLDFSSMSGLSDPADARVLRRSDAVSPWSDATAEFSLDPNARTFSTSSDTVFGEFSIGVAAASLPIQLASFRATTTRLNVVLEWKTISEVDNARFDVERRSIAGAGSGNVRQDLPWTRSGSIAGAGTSTGPKAYTFTEDHLSASTYEYRLKHIDRNGQFKYSQSITVEVGAAPRVFELVQNYPNPFNPSTTIEFTLPADGRVVLKVFDIVGREVATLLDENRKAGIYQQAVFDASRFSSGVYFARLEFGGKQLLKKMVLLK